MNRRINRWWAARPDENCWLEVTRRPDIGANLNAPQANEKEREFWSYSLIKEIREGDLVFHYDGVAQAITAQSQATGEVWEDEVVWAARGSSARSANIAPHSRPGWYLGLERYEKLPSPVTLDSIRKRTDEVMLLKRRLTEEVGEPLYFPFEMSSRRPMRPMQGYIFKLPRGFLRLFGMSAQPAVASPGPPGELGTSYRQAADRRT
jgi:hypothetical protein